MLVSSRFDIFSTFTVRTQSLVEMSNTGRRDRVRSCVFGDHTARILAIIVFVVVCAPCALAGDPTPEVRTGSGIAASKEQCGRGWPIG